MVLGIAIRQRAIAVLGRFFSRTLAVQERQTVVETGPYRYVRHPSYTGALVFFVGYGLALQSWGAVLALVPIFALVYGYRMYVEERLLIAELGEAYVPYSHRTKRLIFFEALWAVKVPVKALSFQYLTYFRAQTRIPRTAPLNSEHLKTACATSSAANRND